jgi:hypothetical protein
MDTEAVRARYRPPRITTLFVGESPPASGKFFHAGNTVLARHGGCNARGYGALADN